VLGLDCTGRCRDCGGCRLRIAAGWRFLISSLDVERDIAGMVIVRMLKIRKSRHAPLGARPADHGGNAVVTRAPFAERTISTGFPAASHAPRVEVPLTGILPDRPSGSVVVPIGASL
jgi:hypothetical protein